MKNKNNIRAILFILFSILLMNCSDDFEIIEDLSNTNYNLLNQDSVKVQFPELIRGKVAVVGYIFTNCPDICPLTTNNMRLIREQIKAENLDKVKFVSISFDPEIDQPSVLKKFSELHGVNFDNWEFLTGEKSLIDRLMKDVGVVAIVGDSTVFDNGSKSYYYIHTDRIQLIDEEGRIRKNYLGSKVNIKEVAEDVHRLID
jgi:protein SCO1/2